MKNFMILLTAIAIAALVSCSKADEEELYDDLVDTEAQTDTEDQTNTEPADTANTDSADTGNTDSANTGDSADSGDPADSGDTAEPAADEDTAEPAADEDIVEPAADEDTVEPADEDIVEPADEDIVEPAADEDIVEPADEDIVEPADEDIVEPADEDIVEPADEDIVEPADEDIVEPADEDIVEPADEDIVEPADEDTVEPADEDIVEPTDDDTDTPAYPECQQVTITSLSYKDWSQSKFMYNVAAEGFSEDDYFVLYIKNNDNSLPEVVDLSDYSPSNCTNSNSAFISLKLSIYNGKSYFQEFGKIGINSLESDGRLSATVIERIKLAEWEIDDNQNFIGKVDNGDCIEITNKTLDY